MLSLDKVFDAQKVLKSIVRETNVVRAHGIAPECELYLKPENLQITGSFKVRGSAYKIAMLSDEEKEHAKKDMGSMLDYIDKLNELDTTGIEPRSHVFKVQNVFREDVVTNGDESEKTLKNAPGEKDNMFMVPKTFD